MEDVRSLTPEERESLRQQYEAARSLSYRRMVEAVASALAWGLVAWMIQAESPLLTAMKGFLLVPVIVACIRALQAQVAAVEWRDKVLRMGE